MTEYSVSSSLKDAQYKYTMETPVFLGWRRVEIKDTAALTDTQATESSLSLYFEQISKSPTPLTWSLIESKVTIDTRAPHHYTEASLIQKLEDLGIGRPSTFSSIVETIQERGYVKKTDVKGIQQKCTEYKLRPSSSSSSQHVLEKTEQEKSFGDEKDKLVIQPTGILVLEFLLQHFDDCFSYDYTKSMETELDVLSSRSSDEALATWHEICRKCFDDITERSKPLAKQTKQTFALSDTADHVLVFNTYGASIKSLSDRQYSKIRPEVELDLEKAKHGEYAMAELIWREDNGCLGEYQGAPVYLKKGKFGLYAEYWISEAKSKTTSEAKDKNTISLKPLNKTANEIVLEDVVGLIEQKSTISKADAAAMFLPQSVLEDMDGEDISVMKSGYGLAAKSNVGMSPANKTLLRSLRPDLSIRKGKYGPYIFHQTAEMSAPKFHPIKPLKDKWESMANLELIAAIENTYRISI
jgi:DNA topoisomerase-1